MHAREAKAINTAIVGSEKEVCPGESCGRWDVRTVGRTTLAELPLARTKEAQMLQKKILQASIFEKKKKKHHDCQHIFCFSPLGMVVQSVTVHVRVCVATFNRSFYSDSNPANPDSALIYCISF